MAMQDYALVAKGAFLVTPQVAAYINYAVLKEEGNVPSEISEIVDKGEFDAMAKAGTLPLELCETSDAKDALDSIGIDNVYCSDFDGEASTMFYELTANPITQKFEDDYIVYVPCIGEPQLIGKAPYASVDEIAEEFQKRFSDVGIKLPDDFDWLAHIVEIDGTYYC